MSISRVVFKNSFLKIKNKKLVWISFFFFKENFLFDFVKKKYEFKLRIIN